MPMQSQATIPKLYPTATGGIELFDEFFESGKEESISPFLTPDSRNWGKNLSLKSSLFSAFLLFFSFLFSFFPNGQALSNLFLLLTYFFAGIPALIASIEDIFSFEINIDVLMTLAAFLSVLIGSGREGALLLVLFSFSGAMEMSVRSKAKGAIQSLKKLAPSKAFVVQENGSLIERSIKDIIPGMLIHVKAGQIVPLDGIVTSGSSSVNLVHLTGENMPALKKAGDDVASGAINLEGALTLKVSHTSSDSTLARIIQLITQAQEAKPILQRWFDKASKGYAISIISLSFIFALTLPLLISIPFLGNEGSVYRALAFLIAASPCALIIAMPIAYLSSLSACARQGILLKGGVILDALAKCTTIAMDKTGTLTKGELVCLGMTPMSDIALSVAYALERSAVHPIAKAISDYADTHKIDLAEINDFVSIPGYGLGGIYQNEKVFIGNAEFILPKLSDTKRKKAEIQAQEIEKLGELYTFLLIGEEVFLFHFKDMLRPSIPLILKSLKENLNMRLVMLTGDHRASALAIAKEAGIDEVFSDLKPEDKMQYITKESQNQNLVMVGDGINDAPALARATVGISMGKAGTGTAIDASDVVLLQDNIELLEWLFRKAKKTVRIVQENVIIATAAIFLASIPALLGWVPLWVAVLLHEGGTVFVGLNALRLLKK